MNEEKILRRIRKILGPHEKSVVVGIGDDAAVVKWTKKYYLLISCDALVEGTHFLPGEISWEQAGRKALAVNLSDIAAMAGWPLYATVSLGLPRTKTGVITSVYRGLRKLARDFPVSIIGGNLCSSDRFFIDITVIGRVEKNRLVLRSGGSPGDRIFVTGYLGGSRYGHHFSFEPRVKLARKLTRLVPVTAMMDISDGLAADLPRLASASRTGFLLYLNNLPASPELSRHNITGNSAITRILNEGEDYELLFTVPEKKAFLVPGSIDGVPITCIGELTPPGRMILSSGEKFPFTTGGFDHFSSSRKAKSITGAAS